jgi:hypothetical protein
LQVLQLLVTPELGSSVVLTATRPLEDSITQQQQQQQQHGQGAYETLRSLSSSPVQRQQQSSVVNAASAAAASPGQLRYAASDALLASQPQQQWESLSAEAAAAAGLATASGHTLPDDVLNIAERDLSALAEAIPAAAAAEAASGEFELEALLDSLVAEATAALEDQVNGETAAADAAELQEQQQSAAAGAVAGAADSRPNSSSSRSEPDVAAAAAAIAESASWFSADPKPQAAGAAADPAAAAESASWFRRPSTLPTLRSWMDRAAVLSAGTAAEGPTGEYNSKPIRCTKLSSCTVCDLLVLLLQAV